MTSGGNVLVAIAWGMRRYLWLVAACVAAIGFLLPAWQAQGKHVYDATAQVGPTNVIELPNLDSLPRAADTTFDNGAVQEEIRDLLNLSPTAPVIPKYVELVAAQDNFIFEVIGHGSTADEAVEIADTAAAAFTIELNKYSALTGGVTVQSPADKPVRPVPTLGGGMMGLALGILGGAVLGTGLVVLLVILRRPVVDSEGAEQASGVAVLGRLRVPRSGDPITDVTELAHVVRAILPHDPQVVWLAAPRRSTRAAQQLADGFAHVWERVERSCVDTPAPVPPEFVVLQKPGEELLDNTRPSMTILVVPVGMRGARLRAMARGYFTGAPMSVVLFQRKGLMPPYLQEKKESPEPTPRAALITDDVLEGSTPATNQEQHLFGGKQPRPKPSKADQTATATESFEQSSALTGRR